MSIATKEWAIDLLSKVLKQHQENGGTITKYIIPSIGKNSNWFINGEDTGISSKGSSIKSITKDEKNNLIVTFTDDTIENIGQLNIDISADFLTEEGFGNLRYYNGHLQSYDTNTSTWIDTSVTPDNVYIINMTPQEMKSFKGIYDINIGYYKLRFEEPSNTIIEGQTACVVEKVVIRRKLGSSPINENDGELVLEIKRKNFGDYKNKWYIDKSFIPNVNETWYYRAFPMSTLGFVNNNEINQIIGLTCKPFELYGFKLDQNESDPASMISYIEDNENFSSAYMDYTSDTFNYGDWEDAWFIKELKPCMLNYDGTVAYELNPDDYTKKLDGLSDSDIANTSFEGNAMVGIPKVYYKIIDNGDDTANIYISNKKVDEDFVCWSHIDNNGNEIEYCYMPIYAGYSDGTRLRSLSSKSPSTSLIVTNEINLSKANNIDSNIIWYTEIYSDRVLINLLLLLIGKSTDTQTIFGNGYNTLQSGKPTSTGTMNNKGLFYGSNASTIGVKIFGMEHWWGNQWRRIAGWICDKGTQKVKLTYGQYDGSTVDGYNIDGSNYISTGYTITGNNTASYITKMEFSKYGLIPIKTNGSSTTYYSDGLWFNNSVVGYPVVGCYGHYGNALGALAVAIHVDGNNTSSVINSSISCKPLAFGG